MKPLLELDLLVVLTGSGTSLENSLYLKDMRNCSPYYLQVGQQVKFSLVFAYLTESFLLIFVVLRIEED